MPLHWADVQEAAFRRWCNDYLARRGMHITDLREDFADGLMLINLLEIISNKPFPRRFNKHPRVNMQKMENLTMALEFIKAEGIELVNIGSEDLASGNIRLILGLIWTLILRYEVNLGDHDDGVDGLLKWVQSKIPEQNITNFTKNWNSGVAVCALVSALLPSAISPEAVAGLDANDKLANATKGIDAARAYMEIDRLVHPDEMIMPKVNKMAMVAYIAQYRNWTPTEEPPHPASLCLAYGPGLQEGIVGQPAPFTLEKMISLSSLSDFKAETTVTASDGQEFKLTSRHRDMDAKNPGQNTAVDYSYVPTVAGVAKVAILVEGDHIEGSPFTVAITEQESLGGEGKIRVFFSTTSSKQKTKHDTNQLKSLLQAKKVHLRPDFEPFIPVDLMSKDDRDAVFRKAGTRDLPIVFIDDCMVGDYDKLIGLEEVGELDNLLKMADFDASKLISEEAHMARMRRASFSGGQEKKE